MKNLCLTLLLCASMVSFSQETDTELIKKSEISTNLLDLVIAGSLNVNYERLFEKNQSLFVGVTFFDTFGYYDAGYLEKTTAVSLKAAYLIYFSKEKQHAGFFFYPQVRLRTGEVTVDDYGYFDYNTDSFNEQDYTYDVSGVSAGFGLGHKWMFNNKFTLTLNGEIARNLGNVNDEYIDNLEARFGVILGYRF
ncbi:DUF3575 domain-containing protein [Subsaximicrobium wynnwilliamsii]|uniref:DUF3575 domain-containing protein n=1 Tax=Subsaximicrobium wynnwilliamsii TaxID=291179 RepID=A0A5C6ZJB2_9FLAO|nr:DUF3575 domain-containing protein [Subsaximicrobium wynnwilliamsii]TXD83712.1 DUF3575 domain-containing protein [Subsaximicrobium wynnwilliamsii]TXD89404.1 DUF3575 domain-containing protein [Subsaximicrobium wynnwilliamsii]TXE03549.1 DUF3575 domain-containing protein [Subsaximicrobium wynnwilliamsii]